MIDFQALRLMHRHSGGGMSPMLETREHDAADHDPEKQWIKGARIFRCESCSDEVIVVPPGEEPGDSGT